MVFVYTYSFPETVSFRCYLKKKRSSNQIKNHFFKENTSPRSCHHTCLRHMKLTTSNSSRGTLKVHCWRFFSSLISIPNHIVFLFSKGGRIFWETDPFPIFPLTYPSRALRTSHNCRSPSIAKRKTNRRTTKWDYDVMFMDAREIIFSSIDRHSPISLCVLFLSFCCTRYFVGTPSPLKLVDSGCLALPPVCFLQLFT